MTSRPWITNPLLVSLGDAMVTTSRVSDSDFGDIRLIENVPLQKN